MAESVAVNGNGSNGFLGLNGFIRNAANTTAVAIIAGVFLWQTYTLYNQSRMDRAEDRAMFKEALRDLQASHDRQVKDLKTSVDLNTSGMSELTAELRKTRTALPKSN
jgi:hypothetical protein